MALSHWELNDWFQIVIEQLSNERTSQDDFSGLYPNSVNHLTGQTIKGTENFHHWSFVWTACLQTARKIPQRQSLRWFFWHFSPSMVSCSNFCLSRNSNTCCLISNDDILPGRWHISRTVLLQWTSARKTPKKTIQFSVQLLAFPWLPRSATGH